MMLALFAVAAVVGADMLSEAIRPPQPDGLSGITRIDDRNYLAVDDSDGRMVSVRMDVHAQSGEIRTCIVTNEVRLADVVDGEGVAYDPLHKTVWVADEKGCRISEHDPKTGKRLSSVRMPPCFTHARPDVGIESLTIASDGLTMWTATEEAATNDGGRATKTSGSVVRLQRFSRKNGKESWKASGQFAYVVDPLGGEKFRNLARSGLSDLCLLPTGELIALEREFSVKGIFPTFRLRLYRVDIKGATDVSTIERLAGQRFIPAVKTLLFDADTGFVMYEGMCLGPKLADGGNTLILISDGDGEALEMVMSVKLRRDKAQ